MKSNSSPSIIVEDSIEDVKRSLFQFQGKSKAIVLKLILPNFSKEFIYKKCIQTNAKKLKNSSL